MSLPVRIQHDNTGHDAEVTPYGELVTGAIEFDESYNATCSSAGVAANLLGPVADKFFVITQLYVKANRNVSNTVDATFELFEATSEDSATVARELYTVQLVRGNAANIGGLRLKLNPGVWLNAKADQTVFYVTVFGYYVKVPAVERT